MITNLLLDLLHRFPCIFVYSVFTTYPPSIVVILNNLGLIIAEILKGCWLDKHSYPYTRHISLYLINDINFRRKERITGLLHADYDDEWPS